MIAKLAYRNLFRNKKRTAITAASVFFAVFFALLMRSLQFGVYDNMIENIVGYYTGYGQVHKNGFWKEKSLDNTLEDTEELRNTILDASGINGLVPRLESFALSSFGDRTKGVIVTGVDPIAESNIMDLEDKLIDGSYFSIDKNACLVSAGLAENLGLEAADTLVLLGQGYHGVSAAGKFVVSGIVKFGSPDLNNNMVFLPIPAAQAMYGAENRLTSYILLSNNPNRIDKTTAALQAKLGDEYEAMDWKQMLPELIQLIEADNIGGLVVLSILYLIIGFGIFGTILMMTNERTYEYGVLISVGLQRWKLILITLVESFMVSFLGVIAGVLFSIPVLIYFYNNPIHLGRDLADFTEKYDIEPVLNFSLNPEIFWTQALYVLVIAIIINVYPIQRIFKLNVVRALRAQ